MKPQELKPGSFIYQFPNALTAAQCADMTTRFEANPEQQYPGRIGQAEMENTSIKKSTDLRISGRENWKDIDRILFDSLSGMLHAVAHEHPFFGSNPFKDTGYNLQRTRAGEFYHWHVDSGPGTQSQRQLVAIWYLNDVPGPGGETEFYFQGIKVRPEQGKLLVFPPFWTHVHRGVALEQGEKYLATTWVCYQ